MGDEGGEGFKGRARERRACRREEGVTRAGAEVGAALRRNLLAGSDGVLGAGAFDELVFTAADFEFVGAELRRFYGTQSEVSAEEDVEAAVYCLETVVTDEDERVESLEDHADLVHGVPAVMAACPGVTAWDDISQNRL